MTDADSAGVSKTLWTCNGGAGLPIWDLAEVKVKLHGFGFPPDMPLQIGPETYHVPFSSIGSAELELTCPALRPGKLELALANTQVTLRCPARSLSFVTQSLPVLASGPLSIAAGDLDGDGHQDLVTASKQTPLVTVLRGDGSGGFQSSSCILSDSPTALSLRGTEIVVATKSGIEIFLFKQGTCQRSQPISSVPNTYLVAVTSQGQDIIALDQQATQVLHFIADGNGRLAGQAPPVALPANWRPVAMAALPPGAGAELAVIPNNQPWLAWIHNGVVKQVDLEGCTPQALTSHPQGKSVYVACLIKGETEVREVFVESAATHRFFPPKQSSSGGSLVTSLIAEDLDGDEWPDLALAWQDAPLGYTYVTVQRTVQVPVAKDTEPVAIRTGLGPSNLAAADFNGDGQIDLAVSQWGYDNVVLLTNLSH